MATNLPIFIIISIALLVGTVAVAIEPIQVSAQTTPGQVCTKATSQPLDPIKMNTVLLPDAVGTTRTIHVEKEIFRCTIPSLSTSGGILRTVNMKDVYIITELPGTINSINNPIFKVITCTRSADGGNVQCGASSTPNNTLTKPSGCIENSPSFPLEMNTVNSKDWVKTVLSEKHVYNCNPNAPFAGPITKIKELTVFNIMAEKPSSPGSESEHTVGTTCVKDVRTATVEGCQVTVGALPPIP